MLWLWQYIWYFVSGYGCENLFGIIWVVNLFSIMWVVMVVRIYLVLCEWLWLWEFMLIGIMDASWSWYYYRCYGIDIVSMSRPLGLILEMKWSRHRVDLMSRPLGLILEMTWSRHRVDSMSRPLGLILEMKWSGIESTRCRDHNGYKYRLQNAISMSTRIYHLMIIYCITN
jgi:hypothetical protein